MVSSFTNVLGSGLANCPWPPVVCISIGSLAPIWTTSFCTLPSEPGPDFIVTWVTTLPILADIPPSTDISMVLPAAPLPTSAIFIVMGGSDPTIIEYCAQLPVGTLARSVTIGVGGPWPNCADATAGARSAKARTRTGDERRGGRDMRGSISDPPGVGER